jgi:hypothetical protein
VQEFGSWNAIFVDQLLLLENNRRAQRNQPSVKHSIRGKFTKYFTREILKQAKVFSCINLLSESRKVNLLLGTLFPSWILIIPSSIQFLVESYIITSNIDPV